MSIRGTSNQSISSMISSNKQHGLELGPSAGNGGAGSASDGAVEYREADNPASGAGTYFIPGDGHLPDGTAQVTVVV